MLGTKQPTYKDGRTKQSFRDETDINQIMKRAQKTGTISHLAKHEGRYADFSNFDFFGNTLMLSKGREIFDELPVELRSEFNQSPEDFFKYVNDPANKDRLGTLLPALAEPGRQNIKTSGVELADDTKAREASASTPKKVADATQTAEPDNGVLKVSDASKPTPAAAPDASSPSTR